jgi:single-stranded-DNA-specific exonuclease
LTRLLAIADRELGDRDLRHTLKIDLEIPANEISPSIFPQIERLQPTGMGNPSALFITRNVQLSEMSLMGKEGTHIRFKIDHCNIPQAVAFNQAKWFNVWKENHPRFDLAFSIEVNRYFDRETQQINVRDMKLSEELEPQA